MTVRGLINYLIELDPDMEVAILVEDDWFPICDVAFEVIEMEDEETGEKENLFLLVPCMGAHEIEEEILPNPNLN